MRAILPVGISIHSKVLLAHRADVAIVGFPVHLIQMAVPPLHPALVRTELLRFSTRKLHQNLSAARADILFIFRLLFQQMSASAKALDGILRKSQKLCNPFIPIFLFTKFHNPHSIFIGHRSTSNRYKVSLHLVCIAEARFSGLNDKKGSAP